MHVRGLTRLFRFRGYRVVQVIFAADVVQVNLDLDRRYRLACPRCQATMGVNRTSLHAARDLSLGSARLVMLRYPARQGRCRRCGTIATIHPPGIDSRRRVTVRLMRYVAALAVHMAVTAIAQFIPVSDDALRRWDKHVLAGLLGPPNLDDLRLLMVDEKAIGKGHQYVTVVLNGETGELLHLKEGRKKETLKAFFDMLTDEQKASIQAVCVDRLGAYVACIEEQLPGAEIVYDKFHLVKNCNAVVDAVRREEWNKARATNDDRTAKLIKNQRYNLLRRAENNTAKQQNRLDELLEMNERLNKTYLLLEDFREALSEQHAGTCQRALRLWLQTAAASGIEVVKRFASRLRRHIQRIVNAVRYDLNNGRLEGFNNLISRVIHRACGYRDHQYLTLKLRHQAVKTPIPL